MSEKRFIFYAGLAVLGLIWLSGQWSAGWAQDPDEAAQAQTDGAQDDPQETDPDDASADAQEGATPAEATAAADGGGLSAEHTWSLISMAVGMATVLGLIIVLKVNAFIALITAAIIVSLMSAGEMTEKITRVAQGFGDSAAGIGIVIAMAAIIGKCMLDSGAADRVVRSFLALFGEKRAPFALMGSGFVLAVPVFFDTVFYLLVPLARSLHRKTAKDYLKYILAISAGGAVTHTLVPPTPGPLVMAEQLGIDFGVMMMIGALVAFPAAIAGLICSGVMNRMMPVPMRPIPGMADPEPLEDSELPSLWLSLLPILLPVVLISSNTICNTLVDNGYEGLAPALNYTEILGSPNLALLLSAVIAIWTMVRQRHLDRNETAQIVETALMSGGVIILITAGGGAFGKMLQAANVGPAIQAMFDVGGLGSAGLMYMVLGFAMASLLKVAQGSSTVAMITGSAMLSTLAPEGQLGELLGYNPVYLATAIGGGSLVGSWMNDSGFWIFTKMGGLTEAESLKSWTIMLAILGTVSFVVSLLLANFLPLTGS